MKRNEILTPVPGAGSGANFRGTRQPVAGGLAVVAAALLAMACNGGGVGGSASGGGSGGGGGGGPSGFAYAVNQYAATVSQLTVGPDGALAALTPAAVNCEFDPKSLAVDPSRKHVYVVNLHGATPNSYGSISQYTVGADGALAPMTPATIAEDYGPSDIAVHPSGDYAYAITFYYPMGGKQVLSVAQYTLGGDGTLTPMSTPAVALTGTPQFIAIHPSGKYLYVTLGGDAVSGGAVAQFTIDQTSGALSAMTPATVASFDGPGHTTFAITVHPSGKYAYVTDYYGRIAEYAIDPTSGALSPLAQTKVDSGYQCAAWIAVDPSGKYAYVANCVWAPAAISQYTIGADGTLTAMTPASVAAASAGTNVQVDASGTHLYMTSGTSGPGDVVSQFRIGANGALTPMTPSTVTVGSGPNALVLVKQ
jgi:6-phosphogluconolactonase